MPNDVMLDLLKHLRQFFTFQVFSDLLMYVHEALLFVHKHLRPQVKVHVLLTLL